MSVAVSEVLAPFADRDAIGLPDLADRLVATVGIGWDYAARTHAVTSGVVRPLPKRGRDGRYQVTREDAATIVLAAIVAAAAGLAIVTVLRGLQALPAGAAALLAAAG